MANRNPKGGQKLTQLGRRRRKPTSPRAGRRPSRAVLADEIKRAPLVKLSQLRKESGAAISDSEMRDIKAFKRLRKESGAAVSDKEMRDFFRFRKTRGK